MKRWHDPGIRTQVIWLALTPAMLIFIVLLGYFTTGQVRTIDGHLNDKGQRVARQIAAASEYTLITGDTAPIDALLRNTLDEDIIAIALQDTQGRVLAQAVTDNHTAFGTHFFNEAVLQPIHDPHAASGHATEVRKLGAALITVSDSPARIAQRHSVMIAVALGSGVLMLAFIMAWMIGRHIVKPLEAVTHVVRKIEDGSLGARTPIRSNGEIGRLQRGINSMADSLESHEKMLRKTIHELKVARQLAEDASQAKGNFLAMMSHELRTPMNGTLGMLELLSHSSLDKSQQQHVDIAMESTRHLLSVVEDVLDFSRIEQGKLELEPHYFGLADMLERCLGTFEMTAARKGLDINLHIDTALRRTAIYLDETRLRQIIVNLLANAIKFTTQGSVTLRAETIPGTGSQLALAITVTDTGIGIPADKISTIFESFRQIDSGMGRQFGGSGLGLAITHRLCDLMGADIEVHSTQGKGSSFRIMLHCNAREDTNRKELTAEKDSFPPLQGCVLVVEDNSVNQFVIVNMLKQFGLAVITANNGIEALAMLREQLPDLILMDCQMPGMDGFQATREIRAMADPQRAGIPIMALTANAMTADRQQCLSAGMDDYISKPVSLRRLYQAIRYWLKHKQPDSDGGKA